MLGLVVRIGEIAGASSRLRLARAAPLWATGVGPRRALLCGPCRWPPARAGGKPEWAEPMLVGPRNRKQFHLSSEFTNAYSI